MDSFITESTAAILEWAKSRELNVATSTEPYGTKITVGDRIAIAVYPTKATTEELLAYQKESRAEGIQLYYIYPWDTDISKLFSHFESKLGLDKRVYAAKRLNLQVIPNKAADIFMKEFHIQGSARGTDKVSLALVDEFGSPLAVQQFSKYRFAGLRGKGSVSSSTVWEGLRLCFRPGVQIHGAASRLQKHFESMFKPSKIVGYISNSHSDGSYKASQGFTLEPMKSQMAYMWVLRGTPKVVEIVDKDGKLRRNDPALSLATPVINPTKIAGAFGKGVGQTFYGGKLGSRAQLGAQAANGTLTHNDVILEAIGYERVYTPGQSKWVKTFAESE